MGDALGRGATRLLLRLAGLPTLRLEARAGRSRSGRNRSARVPEGLLAVEEADVLGLGGR